MKKILKFSDFVKKGEAYNEEKPTKEPKKKINNLSWDSSFGEQGNRKSSVKGKRKLKESEEEFETIDSVPKQTHDIHPNI